LGKILKLQIVRCVCDENEAYVLPVIKIDEVYALVKQLIQKDTSNAGKTMLLQLFSTKPEIQEGTSSLDLIDFNLDQIMSQFGTNKIVTVVSGKTFSTIEKENTQIMASTITTQSLIVDQEASTSNLSIQRPLNIPLMGPQVPITTFARIRVEQEPQLEPSQPEKKKKPKKKPMFTQLLWGIIPCKQHSFIKINHSYLIIEI
jgi:hypothetical protein